MKSATLRKEEKKPALPKVPEVDLTGIRLPVAKVFNPFEVAPLKGQIRQRFTGIIELAGSINAIGQVLPIIVTETSDLPGYKAQLVDGERRLAACQYLKKGVVAFIWDGKTDPEDIYALSVAANFGRQKHDPIEILHAILRFRKSQKSYQEIATIFGKSVAWVCQHYILRKLHPTVQKWLIPVIVDANTLARAREEKGKKNSQPTLVYAGGITDISKMKSTGSRHFKPALNFQIALNLAKIPLDMQVNAGRDIISGHMSIVEANRYLASIGRGVQGFKKRTSPAEQRSTLLSVMAQMRHRIGTYTDMPYAEIQPLLASMQPAELQRLVKSLNAISEDAKALAETVSKFKK